MVLFSVIVPTYNRAKYIVVAIESILQQTYPYYEVIIIDDGSTDETADVIKQNFAKRSQIKYYYKENEERGAARNFGLERAIGAYAVFFDSDDLMLPEYLQILQEIIVKQDAPDLIAAKYIFRDEKGREWGSSMKVLNEGWYNISHFLKGNLLACNFAVRISEGLKLFPVERELAAMEDWLFLLRNLEHKRIYIIDKVGVVMREHSGRSMANNRKIIEARKKATGWVLQHIPLTSTQQKELRTYSTYFYGVHEFLDGDRKSAIQHGIAAIKMGGVKARFLFLLLKAVIGKKTIDRIKLYAS